MIYVTGNRHKFSYGKKRLAKHGINLSQKSIDIVEIQAEDVQAIARDKAFKAYSKVKQPLIVNDASWSISNLKGFPGPYMSYVESWFKTNDFLRLMDGVADRRISLTEVLVFTNGKEIELFEDTIHGQILPEPDGETDFKSLDPIVTFRSDKKSLATARKQKLSVTDRDFVSWDRLAKWLIKRNYS